MPGLRLPGIAAPLLGLIGECDAALLRLERARAVFPERPQSFAAVVENAANPGPDAFGEISGKVRETLKQVDRNRGQAQDLCIKGEMAKAKEL